MILVLITAMLMGWGSAFQPPLSSNCPSDWINAHAEGCFKFLSSDTNTTWFDAQFACERAGGFLAEPKTLEQMEFLRGIASLEESFYGIQFWWIGLSDIGHEGIWTWQHSMEVTYQAFWEEGSPSEQPDNSLDCGYLSLTNKGLSWRDGDFRSSSVGNNPIAPICQKETDTPDDITTTARSETTPEEPETVTTAEHETTPETETTTRLPETTTEVSGCPDAWTEYEGSCFYLIREAMPWLDARENCRNVGGDLASIHSEEQDRFVYEMVASTGYTGGDWWLGGTDSHSEGNWTWSDGSLWNFEHWKTDNGNQGVIYNCVSYHGSSNGYDYYTNWSDDSCFLAYQFICQLN